MLLDDAIDEGMVTNVPARGLPRELEFGLPIPFAVKQTWMGVLWAQVDSKLTMLCTIDSRCHICGEPVKDDEAWGFMDLMERVVDGWVMHRRCGRLALAHCPFLSEHHGEAMHLVAVPERARQLRDEIMATVGAR